MNTNLKLAWRNLWRNRRRTIIAISSIIFSVVLAAFMRSIQEGSYTGMIDNVVKFYSGYLQVQDTAFWDERTLDNGFEAAPELKSGIENIENVTLVSHRIESFALAASHLRSKPAMVLGIEPELEDKITAISKKIVKGSFLKSGDKGAVIGQGLSEYLKLDIGDTLVMISQGYHGISANGLFIIQGIMKHPNQDYDKQLIYLSIDAAREFYSAPGISTSLVVMTDKPYQINQLKRQIAKLLPPNNTVMTWNEMQPELEQIIQSDRAGGIVMLAVLYVVIAFGMFSVVMMMVKERKREFGVIHAVGMRKTKISTILFLETLLIGLIGSAVGLLFSYLLCLYYFNNPIPFNGELTEATAKFGMEPYLFFSLKPSLFYNQMLLVFSISLFISLFPIYNIHKLKITKAMRG
jgi:ABC-type lipoprotein release transport system permease subunit